MRIALIGGYRGLPAGLPGSAGGEAYQEELALRLACRGHHVTAYNRNAYCHVSPGKPYQGVRRFALPSLPARSLATLSHSLLAAIHVIRHDTADLIQIHGMGAALWLPLLRAAGKRSVVMLGGSVDWLRPGWGPMARGVLHLAARSAGRWADALYVDNSPARELLQSYLRRPVHLIPTGAETWPDCGDDRLAAFGVERGRYVLHASGLTAAKGIETLVAAFTLLRTDLDLVIAGPPSAWHSGNYSFNPEDARLRFVGHVSGDERRQLYAHTALYVQPSLVEGCSPSLLAAMGCGVCPVVSDIPANLEVIGEAGVAFRVGDVEDLRSKLEWGLDHPEETRRLGALAAVRARALFDWERVVDEFEGMCRQVFEP